MPKRKSKTDFDGIISLDTETTGTDLYHAACPFLVTICNQDYENTFYEWDVDPRTRQPKVDPADIKEIVQCIDRAPFIVMQIG